MKLLRTVVLIVLVCLVFVFVLCSSVWNLFIGFYLFANYRF